MSTLFKNARAVVGSEVIETDVLVESGTIASIERDIHKNGHKNDHKNGAVEVVDATGKYLLPGGVDVHTHFDLVAGQFRAVDDFHSGTVAAACGGTTTIVDHVAFGPKGCRLGHQIELYHGLAKSAVVDYSFHGVIQHVDRQVLTDMETLSRVGITSYKVYLTYDGKLADPDILKVFRRAGELGIVICVHCENDAMIGFLTGEFIAAGKIQPKFHPLSRPPGCEAEGVYRMLEFARATGDAPLYIVHLSAAQSLQAVREARERGQKRVFVETCPHYLFLDDSLYYDPIEGLKYTMSPPLRKKPDNDALWRGLADGEVDVVGTDHCPFNFGVEKQVGREGFNRCPNGIPGVESRMSQMFSEGFGKGRLSLADVVRVCCTEPARVFGLYPKKGVIKTGSDADLVLFDPDAEWTVSHAVLHERVDYTPYEGMRLKGRPVLTMSRGEVIVRDGEFVGKPGRGKFIVRNLGDWE